MDLGSELGKNAKAKKLLTKHGYDIRPTGPNTSHQNSPGERPQETIGDAFRSMLEGSGLPKKFGVMSYIITLRYTVTYLIMGGTRLHMKLSQEIDLTFLN
eukprot:10276000-Ditylum_brightwellii.AAC.1